MINVGLNALKDEQREFAQNYDAVNQGAYWVPSVHLESSHFHAVQLWRLPKSRLVSKLDPRASTILFSFTSTQLKLPMSAYYVFRMWQDYTDYFTREACVMRGETSKVGK